MHIYTEKDIQGLQIALLEVENALANSSSEEISKLYSKAFKDTKIILPRKNFDTTSSLKIFRVVPWENCPNNITDCSYNPKATQSRCNLEGTHIFYGTGHITGGIIEAFFRSDIEYTNNYKSYIGKRFVLGEWTLNLTGLSAINFLYNHQLDNNRQSELINRINKSINENIAKRPYEQQHLIKELLRIYHDIFFGDSRITASLCSEIYRKGETDLIFYPTAIRPVESLNIAVTQKVADNINILEPIKFNYCEIQPLINEDDTKYGLLAYKKLKVGLPGINGVEIKWLTDKDSMKRYLIKDHIPYFLYRDGKYILRL